MQNDLEVVRIDVDTNRALEVLTGSVFAGANESIRELVANAADSLLQLSAEHTQSAHVRVLSDERRKTLAVRDNGIGMDRSEARELLGKLFSSSKGSHGEYIGRFGVGFYSCLRLCSHVEVFTRSRRRDDRGTLVTFGRGDTMELSAVDVAAAGTTVVLHLENEHHNLLQRSTLRNLIRKYCNFIPFPIYLGDGPDLANEMQAPWEARREGELINELQRVLGLPRPLAVFRLPPRLHENGRSKMSGVLFVGDQDFKPSVHLYVSRVLITNDDTALLPAELRQFVAAFVNIDDVPLVLSRDALVEEAPAVVQARRELVGFFANSLARFARGQREDFARLQLAHGIALKTACCRHSEIGERLCEHLTFRSTQRAGSTIPAYIERRAERVVIYADNAAAAEALLPLYERANLEVLFMCDAVDGELRESWPACHPPFEFRRLDAEPPDKSEDADAAAGMQISATLREQARQLFRSAVENARLDVEVKSLGTDAPAAILAMNEDARKYIEMAFVVRDLGETGRMSELPAELRDAAAVGLVKFMADRAETVLILNADQSLIERFFALLAPPRASVRGSLASGSRKVPPAPDLRNLAPLLARFLYEQALLASGLPLPRTDRNAIGQTQSALVSLLLSCVQPEC